MPTTDVLAQAQSYVALLTAADIRATLNPANINPPAVLIRPPIMHFRFGEDASARIGRRVSMCQIPGSNRP